jgi:hypothetical protein
METAGELTLGEFDAEVGAWLRFIEPLGLSPSALVSLWRFALESEKRARSLKTAVLLRCSGEACGGEANA